VNLRTQPMVPNDKLAIYRLAENLYLQRVTRRMSQEEIADRAGIHRTQMSLFENGHRQPMLLTFVKLGGALGLSPGELLAGVKWEPATIGSGSFVVTDSDDLAARLATSAEVKP
jgi:transcriptional regulator with XRE-family HTH domain